MVFGLFARKQPIKVVAPVKGEVKPIGETPDLVFAEKMMGDGFCVFPEVTSAARVVSPVDGEVVNLFPTGHAVGIRTAVGLEVLVHVGIDTVKLQGRGFRILTAQGAKVSAGQPLLEVDLAAIQGDVPSLATPVVYTNLEEKQTWRLERQGPVDAGDPVATVNAR
ncbi:glucose-specific phosphotransferase system IIA component [Symbiobacterium terraclitae]|uniref:Glucose-specific phosphotransferase system IIA component n=1 Tax=Symbiobacterium terraclitae TaxID=557451 RepID=A0ABS4JSH4_9FIRM|nr:PTS glucose transporter subunit IIA [Symbiobacterium terraclitae]MBP2018460.1 glucose-specific phosphotransferase system IIA component [Symbiobacterium terraclitae]